MTSEARAIPYKIVLPVLYLVSAAIWFYVFSVEKPFDTDDVVFEGVFLVGASIGYFFILKLRIKPLEIGWGVFVFTLFLDFLDEFTNEPSLMNTQVQGLLETISIVTIAFGFYFSQRLIQDEFAKFKAGEKSRRESEEGYRNLFENVPSGLYRTTNEGKILMANSALVKMLGYSSFDELATRDLEKEGFGDIQSRRRFKELLDRDGEVKGLESQWTTRDGSTIWVRENARAVRNEAGVLLHYEGSVENITDRKKVEKVLGENLARLTKKNRYEAIMSAVTRSVHVSIDLQEVLQKTAEAICMNVERAGSVEIYMVEGQAAILKAYKNIPDWYVYRTGNIPFPAGRVWMTISEGKARCCPDAESDTGMSPAERELGIKSYLSFPIRLEGKTAGALNINSFYSNSFDEEELKLLLVVVQQVETAINNARQAEQMRESVERYRALTENAYDLICEIDSDCRYLYLSPNHNDILGYEPDELLDRTIMEIVHPEDLDSLRAEIQNAVESRSTMHSVFKYKRKDGGWRWFEGTGKVFKSAADEIRLALVCRDISERKRIEQDMQRIDKLESLGILAGGIAHDFNNLITAVLGNISLAKTQVNPESKEYRILSQAEKACLRTTDLTKQLLAFSKGGAPVKKPIARLGELIRETTGFAVSGSNVRCEFAIDDKLWDIEADEGQISQVINNLVINAKEAMPKGGTISLKAENLNLQGDILPSPLRNGRYVRLTVEDEGTGIPEELLSNIFDPFFSTKQRGSGLGLATVHSIVKNHGGYVQVESEVGRGTRFYIYLPASNGRSNGKGFVEEEATETKGRVLVMDDEEEINEVTGEMLSRIGYQAYYAKNGTDAIDLYVRAKERGKPFDLVIMDLIIEKGMTGRETIEKLIGIDPEAKAVVSSGYSSDPVMSEYRKYGFKGILTKPYNIEELSKVLSETIEKSCA